jgi:hypothetical protein
MNNMIIIGRVTEVVRFSKGQKLNFRIAMSVVTVKIEKFLKK